MAHDFITAMVEARFAARDAARREYLNTKMKCRICGVVLTDCSIERHPGVCGKNKCRRQAKRLERAKREENV